MLPGIGYQELLVIGVIAVLLFGKKLPEVARSLGGSYREFRRGLTELQSSIQFDANDDRRDQPSDYSSSAPDSMDDVDQPTAPRLEPPPRDDD